jgi:putative flippase GtrA
MSRLATAAPAARKEASRFAKFLVVGAIGFVVDASVFNILTHFANLPEMIAQSFSFLAAVVSNFTFNRYWTYPDSRSKSIRRQLVQFTAVNLVGWGIRWYLLALIILTIDCSMQHGRTHRTNRRFDCEKPNFGHGGGDGAVVELLRQSLLDL